jgi:hypothetical protein
MKKIIIAALMGLALAGCSNGHGEKIGMVTKVAEQGAFCPSYEAEIIRGGFNNGSGVSGQSFHFTIRGEENYKKVKEAMEGQKEVKLTYDSRNFNWCADSDHFLSNIEVIEREQVNAVDSEAKIKNLLRELISEVQK